MIENVKLSTRAERVEHAEAPDPGADGRRGSAPRNQAPGSYL